MYGNLLKQTHTVVLNRVPSEKSGVPRRNAKVLSEYQSQQLILLIATAFALAPACTPFVDCADEVSPSIAATSLYFRGVKMIAS